jgi:hypothetical protein
VRWQSAATTPLWEGAERRGGGKDESILAQFRTARRAPPAHPKAALSLRCAAALHNLRAVRKPARRTANPPTTQAGSTAPNPDLAGFWRFLTVRLAKWASFATEKVLSVTDNALSGPDKVISAMPNAFSTPEKHLSGAPEVMSETDRLFGVMAKVLSGTQKVFGCAEKVLSATARDFGVAEEALSATAKALVRTEKPVSGMKERFSGKAVDAGTITEDVVERTMLFPAHRGLSAGDSGHYNA